MFFHIPLYASILFAYIYRWHQKPRSFSQESHSEADIDFPMGKPLDISISGLEGKGSAKGNKGFCEKCLMTALESNHRARWVYREVKVVTNGHSYRTSVLHITIYRRFKLHFCLSDRKMPRCQGPLDVFWRWRVRVVFHGIELLESLQVRLIRSYSGFGKVGSDRRFRIFYIYGETIRTYKRTEHDEILDQMSLVGDGFLELWEGV